MGAQVSTSGSAARIETLDALRGIAAVSVVASHIIFVLPSFTADVPVFAATTWADPVTWFRYTPLRALVGGPPAVIIFFMLSGFVLSLSFLAGKSVSYGNFIWRRFFRIYVPFLVAICIAAALYYHSDVRRIDFVSDWFNSDSWTEPLTPALFFGHILMIGTKPEMSLNNVMWSLVHEVRISIIFPVIMILVIRSTRYSLAASGLLLLLSTILHRMFPGALMDTWLDTVWYVPFFVVGALIAKHRQWLVGVGARLGTRGEVPMLAMAVVLLAVPAGVPFAELPYGIAGAMLIALAIADGALARFLQVGLFEWFGKISYSLYLVHLPIILATTYLAADWVPLPLVLLGSFILSLAVAEVVYRVVELPSIAVGRRGPFGRARKLA